MATKGQDNKGFEFNEGVTAFFELADRINNREALDNATIRSGVDKIVAALGSGPAAFAGAVKLVAELRKPTAAPVPAPPVKVSPPKWDSKKVNGKKTTWFAKWEGMKLRVERKKTGDMGVIFDGFIDDRHVTRVKHVTTAQTEVAAEAYRILTQR